MINRNLLYYSKIVFAFTIFAFANLFFTLSSSQFEYNSDGSLSVLNARWFFAFLGCVFAYSFSYRKDRKLAISKIALINAILFLILPFCRNQYLFNFIVLCYGLFIYILQFLPILFVIEFKRNTNYLSSCLQIMFLFQSLDELLGRQIIKWIYEYDESTGKSTKKPDNGLFGTASYSSLWIPFLAISFAEMVIAALFWPLKDEFLKVPTEPPLPEGESKNKNYEEYKVEEAVQVSIENQEISSSNQIEMNIEDDQNVYSEKIKFEQVHIKNLYTEKNNEANQDEQIKKIDENDQIENINESCQTAKIGEPFEQTDQIEEENQTNKNKKKRNQIYSNGYANFFIIVMGLVIGIVLAIQENVKKFFLLSDQLNESELDESQSKSKIQLIFACTVIISRLINIIITFKVKELTFRLMILISLIFIFIGNLVIAFKVTYIGIVILAYGFSSILQMVILHIEELVKLNIRRICLLYLMISIFQLMKIYIPSPFSDRADLSNFFYVNALFTSASFLFYFQLLIIDFCRYCIELFNFIGSFMG